MAHYRQLVVWQRSYDFVLRIYRHTAAFPHDERFRLADQMRRAVASIPLNIAEGSGRCTNNEQRRFLRIARGSTNELTCQLLLARDLGYLTSAIADPLIHESEQLGAMITSWIHKLDPQRRSPQLPNP